MSEEEHLSASESVESFVPVAPKKSRISLKAEPEILIQAESFYSDSEYEEEEQSSNFSFSFSDSKKSDESSSNEISPSSTSVSGSGSSEELVLKAMKNIMFKQPFFYRPKSMTKVRSNSRSSNGSIHRHHEHFHDHHFGNISARPSRTSIRSIKSFIKHNFRMEDGKIVHKKSCVKFHKLPFHSQFFHSHPSAHIQRTKLSRISKKFMEDELTRFRDADIVISRPSEKRIRQTFWTKPRLEWLQKLEAETEVMVTGAILKKDKEYRKQDICCFPFSTFRLFNKKKAKAYEYYKEDCNLDGET